MAIREGRWLCKGCGAENLGRYEECNGLDGQSGCNKGREHYGPVRFYLPEDSPIVTDPELLADANSGPDWTCDHCGCANKNAYHGHKTLRCVHCNQQRDERDEDYETHVYSVGEVPTAPPKPERKRNRRSVSTAVKNDPVIVSRNSLSWDYPAIAVVTVGVLIFGYLIWFLFLATSELTASVEGFSWQRSVEIERYQTIEDEGWDMPADARETGWETRVHHYEKVFSHNEPKTRQVSEQVPTGTETYVCGTKDLGNGYFEDIDCTRDTYTTVYTTETYEEPVYDDEPVYETWYFYEMDRWTYDRTVPVSGEDQDPYWPEYRLTGDKERLRVGNERLASESESYAVHFRDSDGERYKKNFPEVQWSNFYVGQAFVLTVNRVGAVLDAVPK